MGRVRNYFLIGAIDEQIQIFKDDRANQCSLALGLHDCIEHAVAVKQIEANLSHARTRIALQ